VPKESRSEKELGREAKYNEDGNRSTVGTVNEVQWGRIRIMPLSIRRQKIEISYSEYSVSVKSITPFFSNRSEKIDTRWQSSLTVSSRCGRGLFIFIQGNCTTEDRTPDCPFVSDWRVLAKARRVLLHAEAFYHIQVLILLCENNIARTTAPWRDSDLGSQLQ
jgi:hypothetical protein